MASRSATDRQVDVPDQAGHRHVRVAEPVVVQRLAGDLRQVEREVVLRLTGQRQLVGQVEVLPGVLARSAGSGCGRGTRSPGTPVKNATTRGDRPRPAQRHRGVAARPPVPAQPRVPRRTGPRPAAGHSQHPARAAERGERRAQAASSSTSPTAAPIARSSTSVCGRARAAPGRPACRAGSRASAGVGARSGSGRAARFRRAAGAWRRTPPSATNGAHRAGAGRAAVPHHPPRLDQRTYRAHLAERGSAGAGRGRAGRRPRPATGRSPRALPAITAASARSAAWVEE